jgi:transcription termination/antitermination protein NusA
MTPAKVQRALANTAEHVVDIIVADDQLALAIGKRGQNAKLAVKLTKWRINITSESERKYSVQESFEKAFPQTGFGDAELEAEDVQTLPGVPDDHRSQQTGLRKSNMEHMIVPNPNPEILEVAEDDE